MSHSVCNQCNFAILTEELRTSEHAVCPKCGNKHFTMHFEFTLQFLPHNTTKVKQKDPYRKGKSKVRREHFVGMQENKDGQLMLKERLIDKDADTYFENVKDPISGVVLRLCNQKLTEHTNRGSAKKKESN
jgi:DNA-directed RNA polymerase subunit RPC12/RpoP